MDSDYETLRKERSWLGPLVIGLLVELIVMGALWFSELRSHGQSIDNFARQIGSLESRVTALESERTSTARMDEQIKQIAADVQEMKSDVKTLDAKVSAIRRR